MKLVLKKININLNDTELTDAITTHATKGITELEQSKDNQIKFFLNHTISTLNDSNNMQKGCNLKAVIMNYLNNSLVVFNKEYSPDSVATDILNNGTVEIQKS